MQYEIVIKNEKIKSYRTIAFIVLLFNLIFFTLLLFYDARFYAAASSVLLTGIYIFLRLYFIKKYQKGNYLDEALMFVLAGCWLILQNYYIAMAMVILGVFYRLALQKIKIVFNAESVARLNFPQKNYEWNVFNNVIIKDNILTLDFKNNHLLQAEIEEQQNINENEFNSFAKTQLNRTQVS